MSSSTFTSSLYLLTSTLLLQNVLGIDPLYSSCSGNENSAANYGSYKTSLKVLMVSFCHLAPANNKGFALGSLGQNNQDRPYGLVFCIGDVSPEIAEAVLLMQLGRSARAAQTRKQQSYFTITDFFGKIDNGSNLYIYNEHNVSNLVVFNQKTNELLGQLANKAFYYTTKMYYATEEIDLEGIETRAGHNKQGRDRLCCVSEINFAAEF
ncbi:unnamed protein product, partial [Dovyalis caffra]